jgi:hypothetical protein
MACGCVLFIAMSCGTGGARRTTKGTTENDDRGIVIRVVGVPAPGEPAAADARRRVPKVADTACLREFHGQADLIHATVSYPACVSVANLARQLRGATARAIRRSRDIKGHVWSKTYYAASVGAHSSATFDQYVERLEQPVNN